MQDINLLPDKIQILTPEELIMYCNTAHSDKSIIIGVIPAGRNNLNILTCSWNGVQDYKVFHTTKPGYIIQENAKGIADFMGYHMFKNPITDFIKRLIICVDIDGHNDKGVAYGIAAAIADWATCCHALDYYTAALKAADPTSDTFPVRPDRQAYSLVAENLNGLDDGYPVLPYDVRF